MQAFLLPLLGLAGFSISSYLYIKHARKESIICPLKAHCNSVIASPYGKMIGVSNTVYGMVYFTVIALAHLTLILFPQLHFPIIDFSLFTLTIFAALFSIYLLAIQAFVLRNWCSWCVVIAIISLGIFSASFSMLDISLIRLFVQFRSVFFILHLIALALGVGGAMISDIFFFRFLKDLRISHEEKATLHVFSQIVWVGIGLFLVSGFGLYLPFAEAYQLSAKFIAKMIVVAIIIVNGGILTFFISPQLEKISFHEKVVDFPGELRLLRKVAFALGAVSATSWLSALILGALHSLPFSIPQILFLYFLALLLAVSLSLLVESRLTVRGRKSMK